MADKSIRIVGWLVLWTLTVASSGNAIAQADASDASSGPSGDDESLTRGGELKHIGGRAYRGNIVGDGGEQTLAIVSLPEPPDGPSMAILHLFGDTDDGEIDWRSGPFPYCTEGDCERLSAPQILDLNADGAPDLFLENWVTGMGGHWANVAWIFDATTGAFLPAYFRWQPEAVSDLGSTFASRSDPEAYGIAPCESCTRALWQAGVEGGLVCSNWNEYGQYIDQIYLNSEGAGRYIHGYKVCFGPAEDSVFEIRRITETSWQTVKHSAETGYVIDGDDERRVVFPSE